MVIYGDLMGFNGDLWWFYGDPMVMSPTKYGEFSWDLDGR